MLAQLYYILKSRCKIVPNKPVIVGVSGGPDSVCLLDGMWHLGYPLLVVHVNHGLRPEADADAQMVAELAGRLDVSFVLEEADAGGYAEAKHLSVEEAARNIRYGFLFKHANRIGAQAVLTAHTADDQVETVMMHLLRGAGISGLQGMDYTTLPTPWSKEIPLVRPLLGIWRTEILDYLRERKIEPVYDRSNQDVKYHRNRLRHELLPYLETYNPKVRQSIWQTAELLREDDRVLQEKVDPAWEACLVRQEVGGVALSRQRLASQQLGILRRVFRRAVSLLRPGMRDIDFNDIERAIRFLQTPSDSGIIDLAAGLCLRLEGDLLWVARWDADLPSSDWPQVADPETRALQIPGKVELSDGWTLLAEWVKQPELALQAASENTDPYQAWLSGDDLVFPLIVRGRRPGEKFQPHGMGGHSVKLSDFMINQKIPQRARAAWPLVCGRREGEAAETVIWVAGIRQSESLRLNQETGARIHLWLRR